MVNNRQFNAFLRNAPAAVLLAATMSPFVAMASAAPHPGAAADRPVEIHQRLVVGGVEKTAALTLDACGGGFDASLVDTLVALKVPATIFATRRWIDRHPEGVAALRAHPELFAIEDHGAEHVPAVVGAGKKVYGLRGATDVAHLRAEIDGGARAIAATGADSPRWYRGATAMYDRVALETIQAAGYRVAGFSLNGDAGATLPRRAVATRLLAARNGDIIIAHMNKPASDTAKGLRDALPVLIARGFNFVTLSGREVAMLPRNQARN